jgi:photosystem II stability/assembly factor-like uncharacterized protein
LTRNIVLVILASCEDTMSILTRPRPPRPDLPPDPEALEALIEEARRRTRRRRRGYAACALVAAAAGLLVFYGFNGGGATRPQGHENGPVGGAGVGASGDTASWKLAHGLPGGDIDELVVVPQHARVMFASSAAGVFKSANGGRTWRPQDLSRSRVDELAMAPADPKTLYVGTARGVFKTTDGGASWEATSADLLPAKETAERRQHRLDEGYVYALVVDRRDPDIVYAGTWEKGVFKTTDGGASWRSVGLGSVNTLALDPRDPDTIYAGAVGAAVGAGSPLHRTGVFKSSDGGASWQPVGLQGTNVAALALDPQHPKTVYAGTDEKGVVKSTDGGASWHPAGLQGTNVGPLMLDPQHPETVYARTDENGVFKSTDGGRTWRALTMLRGAELLGLHPGNPAKLYARSSGRILTSLDAGHSWRATGRGPGTASISAFAVDARTGTAYAGIDQGGIAKKVGGRWRTVNTDQSVSALAVDPQDPDVLYAGAAADAARLLKSTDGGRSWRALRVTWQPWIDPDLAVVSELAVDPQNPKAVYAYVDNFADNGSPDWFKSTDGGATWEIADDAFFSAADGADSYPSALAFDPLDPDTRYAYGEGAALFKSTNGGATWQRAGYPFIPASLNVENLAIDPREPATLYAAAGEQDESGEGIFKSTDAGSSWRAVGLKGHNLWALAIDPRQRQTVYAGTESGLFRSTDGGGSWSRFSRGLPSDGIETVAVDPARGILYAVLTDGGIYELRLPR